MNKVLFTVAMVLGFAGSVFAQSQNKIHRVESGGGVEQSEDFGSPAKVWGFISNYYLCIL